MTDSSNTDWGLKKEYLHSTRQHLWNNDYVDFVSAGHADSDSYLAARCHVISYGYK